MAVVHICNGRFKGMCARLATKHHFLTTTFTKIAWRLPSVRYRIPTADFQVDAPVWMGHQRIVARKRRPKAPRTQEVVATLRTGVGTVWAPRWGITRHCIQ